eukprot:1762797-Prymnesium_polylepis.1
MSIRPRGLVPLALSDSGLPGLGGMEPCQSLPPSAPASSRAVPEKRPRGRHSLQTGPRPKQSTLSRFAEEAQVRPDLLDEAVAGEQDEDGYELAT